MKVQINITRTRSFMFEVASLAAAEQMARELDPFEIEDHTDAVEEANYYDTEVNVFPLDADDT